MTDQTQDTRHGGVEPRPPVPDLGFFAGSPTAPPGGPSSPVPFGSPAPFGSPTQVGPAAQPGEPAPFGTPAPFGGQVPPPPLVAPAPSGLPAWAIVLIAVGGLFALGIVAAVAIPVFLSSRQHSLLAATTVSTPTTLLGLPRSADPAIQSQASQLATGIPIGFTGRESAGYVGDGSSLFVVAAKPPHVLILAEQESLTRSFWAHEAASVPEGSSLAAPSTPAGAGATGTLTCADEITPDGTATVCIDAQATALVVFVLASTGGSDPSAAAQVPPAVVHVG